MAGVVVLAPGIGGFGEEWGFSGSGRRWCGYEWDEDCRPKWS